MSAGIETYGDKAAFFSAREDAWHRLGTTTADCLTAEQALKTAYLYDWDVQTEPAYTASGLVIPGDRAITRKNPFTGVREPLAGGAGKIYTPIQNEDLTGFLDAVVDQSGAHYETAGAINGGRDVFVTMKLPETMLVGGEDRIDVYIASLNNHSGQFAARTLVTPTRIVCKNTQAVAISNAVRMYKVRHTTNALQNIQQAREALSLTFKYLDGFQSEADKLIDQSYTDAEFDKLVRQLVGEPEDATSKRGETSIQKAIDALEWSFSESPTNDNIRGTKWGAYQAVTEYADWMYPVRGGDDDMKRALRTANGSGDKLKLDAWELLTAAN